VFISKLFDIIIFSNTQSHASQPSSIPSIIAKLCVRSSSNITWKLRAKPLTWNSLWFHPDPAGVGFIPTAPFGDTRILKWHKIRWKDFLCMFSSQVWQQAGQKSTELFNRYNCWLFRHSHAHAFLQINYTDP